MEVAKHVLREEGDSIDQITTLSLAPSIYNLKI